MSKQIRRPIDTTSGTIGDPHHCSNRLEDHCPITGSHCTGRCLNDRWATPPDHMPQTLADAITEIYLLRETEHTLRARVADMVGLVKRAVSIIKRANPRTRFGAAALDYLARNGLIDTPMREGGEQ